MNLSVVQIEKPADVNVILGHSHFIKTVEDLYETIVQTNPGMKFGVAFCEASGPTLLRFVGNDEAMITLAQKNGMAIAAGPQRFASPNSTNPRKKNSPDRK